MSNLNTEFIYENNYLLFVFLENFKRNLLSKKLMESYLKEKGINDSYDISCVSKELFCNDINLLYTSKISEKEVLDIINHFYQITKKNHIIFLQNELKKKYNYYLLTHGNKENLIFVEKETKNLLSQLENNYFDINYINEIEVGTINSKNQILNNMILGFVFGFFLSLFLIFLRFGYQNFRFEKKY